jgi:hypothetical protein
LYVDGALVGTTARNSTSFANHTNDWRAGTYFDDTATRRLNGDMIYGAALRNNALSAEQIAELWENPFGLFEKQTARIYSFPSGASGTTISVPAGSLTLTGYAPTVVTSDHKTISVPSGTLTLTGYAPTVSVAANVLVSVPFGTLTLTGYAPTVLTTANQTVSVPSGTLTLTGYAPTVAVSGLSFNQVWAVNSNVVIMGGAVL